MNLNVKWYAHPNDLIGGWSIMNCDKRISQAIIEAGDREIASFMGEDEARHMVQLHNRWLGEFWEDC